MFNYLKEVFGSVKKTTQEPNINQQQIILRRLKKGEWIKLPIIKKGIAQYNTRILELRAKGHQIWNKTTWVQVGNKKEKHSFYMLIESENDTNTKNI